MKKRLILIMLCALLTVSLLPLTALAEDTSPADGYNDHDYDALRAYLETEVSGTKNGYRVRTAYNADDPMTWEVTWVEMGGEKYAYGINWNDKGLTGTLDVSGFVHLSALYVSANSLNSINTTGCTDLGNFTCNSNGLDSLDLSTNTNLGWLDCTGNDLTSLDTSAAGTNLYYLWCQENELTTLNISGNTGVYEIYCYGNALTSLDVSGFTSLTTLSCDNNELTSLNVSGCTAMTELYCYTNHLSALDLSGDTALTRLDCSENSLTLFDPSAATLLDTLDCSINQITALDVSGLTALTYLQCDDNRIFSLDFSGCPLEYLSCENNLLTSLDVSGLTSLTGLGCSDNNIGSLDISHNTLLTSLGCDNCGLTSLDVSANTGLRIISCSGNDISALDLSGLTDLFSLECSDNSLTALDISKFDPYMLDATGNPFASITAAINKGNVTLAAEGDGYVGLYYENEEDYYAEATPKANAVMINWTDSADAVIGTDAKRDLTAGTAYDLTAHFIMLTLTPSVTGGSIYTGGRITLTPSVAGGTWDFNTALLSRDGSQFTGRAAGTARVTYTVGTASVYFDVIIEEAELPETGQDSTFVFIAAIGAALALVLAAAGTIIRKRARASQR